MSWDWTQASPSVSCSLPPLSGGRPWLPSPPAGAPAPGGRHVAPHCPRQERFCSFQIDHFCSGIRGLPELELPSLPLFPAMRSAEHSDQPWKQMPELFLL